MASLEQTLTQAIQHFQAGRTWDSETLCKQVLSSVREEPNALHLLGVMRLNQQQPQEALTLFDRAISACSDEATFHMSRGLALKALDRLPEAIEAYRQAVRLHPDFVEALSNLGNALNQTDKYDQAVEMLTRAVRLRPTLVAAQLNLANALKATHRIDEAIVHFERALKLSPNDGLVHMNLASAHLMQQQRQLAATHYERAGELRQNDPHVFAALGRVYRELGQLEKAVRSLETALRISTHHIEANNHMGMCLLELERPSQAMSYFDAALLVAPQNLEVRTNIAVALIQMQQYSQAAYHLAHVLSSNPQHVDALINMAIANSEMGRTGEAVRLLRRALQADGSRHDAHARLIFLLDLDPQTTLDTALAERRRFNDQHASAFAIQPHHNDADLSRPLRVGYVSADFCRHSAAAAFGAVITSHDDSAVQVYCYSGTKVSDEWTDRFKAAARVWRDVAGLSDDQLAAQIRDDGIDILVDLSGFSQGHRLLTFARKPAPVQATAWGYATSTGLTAMDYFFADAIVVPASQRDQYVERVVDLPNILCYEPPSIAPQVAPLPALQRGRITFGSLNRLSKITSDVLTTWATLLTQLPQSRLLIKDTALNDPSNRDRITGYFKNRGIDLARLDLRGGTTHAEHLAAYNDVDIALDPFPNNGGISTLESLWMGVPVVTLAGERVPGRVGASILTSVQLNDWIATTNEQYVQLAMQHADDMQALARLRSQLRGRLEGSILCRKQDYTRKVEQLYREIWHAWCTKARRTAAAA